MIKQSWPIAAALGSSALIVMAAPGVLPWSWASLLAWLGFVPLLLVLEQLSLTRAVLVGWLAGVLINAGVSPWMPGVLARYSGMAPWLAIGASLALWAWTGLAWAAWAGCVRYVRSCPWSLLAAACLFVAIERWMPMVFPYSLGMTQYRNLRIAQAAEWGGPYVLSMLMVLWGAAGARMLRATAGHSARPWRLVALLTAATLVTLGAGAIRLASQRDARQASPVLRVGVVQASQVQTGWTAREQPGDVLARYQEWSGWLEQQPAPPALLVWPEKAYPLLLRRDAAHDYPSGHARRIRRGFQAPLVFGADAVDASTRELSNAVFLLHSNGRFGGVYDKVRLIPYSEWVPSFLDKRVPGGRRYRAGVRYEPLVVMTAPGAVRAGTFICFESAFPSHVRGLMEHNPDILLNLSDDTWFGASSEPEQHLAQVVFRAIEARRDLVRATGSGISALVASTGEIEQRLPVGAGPPERGAAMIVEARLVSARTLQAPAALFPWLCTLASIAALADAWRRRTAHPAVQV